MKVEGMESVEVADANSKKDGEQNCDDRTRLPDDLLRRFVERLEATRIAEYVQLLDRPSRLLYLNFLAGVARGLGFAIGATILAAVVLYILQRTMVLNLPVIGEFVAEIVRIVEEELRR